MVVPVRVDRRDPRKVAVDVQGAFPMAAFDQQVKTAATPYGGGGGGHHPELVKVRASDVVGQGVATQGRIVSAQPAGMTAGQVEPGLPPHEAGDPLFRVAFAYAGPGGVGMHKDALLRVPHGKVHLLAPGSTVPIAYLPPTRTSPPSTGRAPDRRPTARRATRPVRPAVQPLGRQARNVGAPAGVTDCSACCVG